MNKYLHSYLYTNVHSDIIIYTYASIYLRTKVNICICGNIQTNTLTLRKCISLYVSYVRI